MTNAIEFVATAILSLCILVVKVIGAVDHWLTHAMDQAGISQQNQMLILLVVSVLLVVLALRTLGGLLGWMVLILLVLLLLHRVVPATIFHGSFIPAPLQTTL